MHPKLRTALLTGLVTHLTALAAATTAHADEPESASSEEPAPEEAEQTEAEAEQPLRDPVGLTPGDPHNCGGTVCGALSSPNPANCGGMACGALIGMGTEVSCGAKTRNSCGAVGTIDEDDLAPKAKWAFSDQKLDGETQLDDVTARHLRRVTATCRNVGGPVGTRGELELRFVVAEGAVTSAKPIRSPHSTLAKCALDQLKRAKFPADLDGEHTLTWTVVNEEPRS